jgi:hypothetical protein
VFSSGGGSLNEGFLDPGQYLPKGVDVGQQAESANDGHTKLVAAGNTVSDVEEVVTIKYVIFMVGSLCELVAVAVLIV